MNKTKKAIFQSAVKVFSNSGYSGATMDDIALAAGVAKGTLYYHFKSKEEIFNYIMSEGMDLIKDEVKSAADAEENVLLKMRTMVRIQLKLVYENKDFFKVIMSQVWGQELRQLELRKLLQGYLEIIEGYLEEAMEHGVIKKGDSKFMAYTFFGTLCSAAIYELINSKDTDIDGLIDSLMEYVLKGIQN
ncbi:TetR/AcrR family transcriptional regulator [Clostridium sp.]|uniref:TetR/AcrR family transcriptional regulator n=1 Tax=Clostridium sp. TaxID=1506 RepID=UPI003463DCE5